MYSGSRIVARTALPSASPLCVRFIGIQKQKTSANVKKKKNVQASAASPSKKSSKKPSNGHKTSRGSLKNVYAGINHSLSPILHSLAPEMCHEIYSKFCLEVLKNYGFNLQLSDSNKNSHSLSGNWSLPGHSMDIVASCSLQKDDIKNHRNNFGPLEKRAPENAVSLLINNVGFKGDTVRKFVTSEKPCILMSVSDSTLNWLGQVSPYQKRREKIDKCLHHQLWDHDIGFSTHKFSTSSVTIPRHSLTQGLSLLLFNKAFISHTPKLSAGKFIYQWPKNTKKKRLLKTYFYSTILLNSGEGKRDLFDVLQEEKRRELELYYAAQMRNFNEIKGVDVTIGDILGIDNDSERDEYGKVILNPFSFLADESFVAADDEWRVH